MKRRNVYLGDDQLERLEQLSTARGLLLSEMLRRVIDAGLDQIGAPMMAHEALLAEIRTLVQTFMAQARARE